MLHNEAASSTPALEDAPANCTTLGIYSVENRHCQGTSTRYPNISVGLPTPAVACQEARGTEFGHLAPQRSDLRPQVKFPVALLRHLPYSTRLV